MWYPIVMIILVGYLLGDLNGAVLVSNLVQHEDVRSHGSGNAGLTNFIRNYGGWSTFLVILVDGGKAFLSCLLGGLLLKPYGLEKEGMALGGVVVSIGHDFPGLLGFKGGKGILSGVCVAFAIDWRIGLIITGVFAIFYFPTMYVSLGSVMGAVAFMVCGVIFYHSQPWVMAGCLVVGGLAVFMHRANIRRLLAGKESKTNLFKKGSKK